MTSFTYNTGVPAAPDNPSVDQPQMLTNTQSINTLIAVDHVSFNDVGSGPPDGSGGHHLKISFDSKNPPIANPTDPVSILYTNNVTATATNTASASTVSEIFYRNQNGVLPVSMFKAFGSFSGAGTLLNGFNISPAVVNPHPSAGLFNLEIPPNILTGTSYSVFLGCGINVLNPNRSGIYVIVSATQLSIAFRNTINGVLADPDQFSVLILQL